MIRRAVAMGMTGLLLCGCGLQQDPQPSPKPDTTEVVTSAESLGTQNQGNLVDQAIALLKEAKILEAVQTLDTAIMQDPSNLQAYVLLGQTYMRTGNYDKAVDTLRAALNVAPDHGDLYYMLALNNRMRGQSDLALEDVQKALTLFQKDQDEEKFKMALALLQELSRQ